MEWRKEASFRLEVRSELPRANQRMNENQLDMEGKNIPVPLGWDDDKWRVQLTQGQQRGQQSKKRPQKSREAQSCQTKQAMERGLDFILSIMESYLLMQDCSFYGFGKIPWGKKSYSIVPAFPFWETLSQNKVKSLIPPTSIYQGNKTNSPIPREKSVTCGQW